MTRVVRVLLVTWFAWLVGCGGREYPSYIEPPGANACLVIHPQSGDTFDIILDGKLLGRIS